MPATRGLAASILLLVLAEFGSAAAPPPVGRDWYGDPLPRHAVARLGTTRLRHPGGATQLAFSGDGKLLASSGHGVRVWRVSDGALVRRVEGLTCVSRSKGRLLALKGSGDPVIQDVLTGEDVSPTRWPSPGRYWRRFSAATMTGAVLPFAESEGVSLWNLNTGETTGRIKGDFVSYTMAFSADGKTLVTGNRVDEGVGHIRFWDVATRKLTRDLSAGCAAAYALALSDDGKTLAVAHARVNYFDDDDQTESAVSLRDAITGRELRVLSRHGPRAVSLAFSPDGKTVAVGRAGTLDWAGTIELYETGTGKKLDVAPGHRDKVVAVAFRPGGEIVTCDEWEVRAWSDAGKPLALTDFVLRLPRTVTVSPDGTRAVWVTEDEKLFVHDLKTGEEQGPFGPVESAGEQLVWRGRDKGLMLWNSRVGLHPAPAWNPARKIKTIMSIHQDHTFSADGARVALGGYDTPITLHDAATGKKLRSFEAAGEPIYPVLFSADDKTLVACGGEQNVSLWDVATGKRRGPILSHPSGPPGSRAFAAVALSPDGRLLATGGAGPESTVRLWDVATGKERTRLPGHALAVSLLRFSPDGKRLLSCSWDSTALIWDVAAALTASGPARPDAPGK